MSDKREAGLRYFDITAAGIMVIVTTGLVLGPLRRGAWMPVDLGTLVTFLAVSAGFLALRRRAYTQGHSWLIAVFAAFLGIAMLIVAWQLPLMWAAFAIGAGVTLFLAGLVAPTKHIGYRFTRLEAFKLVTLAGAVMMTLAFVEGVLRFVPGLFSDETRQLLSSTPGNSGIGHPYIGHLQRPNRANVLAGKDFTSINHVDGLGFRNRWPWPAHADIVAVGDSLTFGFGVADDQAWPAIVARMTHTQVINLGLVGASPEQYFRVYETFGAELRPKVLLVGIFAQNDFWDAGLFDEWLRTGAGDNYMVWRDFGRPRRVRFDIRHPVAAADALFRAHVYPAVRSSYLYNLMRAIHGGDGTSPADVKTARCADGRRVQLMPSDFVSKTAGAQPGRREFGLVVDALRKIQALAAEHGTHALLVLQPSKEEVYLPVVGEPLADPTRGLRPELDAAGIEYLDLTPAFRQRAAAGDCLFFEVDSHPNVAGYALIGQVVGAHLQQQAASYDLER